MSIYYDRTRFTVAEYARLIQRTSHAVYNHLELAERWLRSRNIQLGDCGQIEINVGQRTFYCHMRETWKPGESGKWLITEEPIYQENIFKIPKKYSGQRGPDKKPRRKEGYFRRRSSI